MRLPRLEALPAPAEPVVVAGPGDEAGLADLLDSAFEEHWDVARVRRDLLEDSTVRRTFVVRDGARIVATASQRYVEDHPGTGYLHWVAAHPEARGRRLGRTATLAVLHAFLADGLHASVLETDDERLPAITVYLELGYVPVYRADGHEERWSQIFRALGERRGAPAKTSDPYHQVSSHEEGRS